MLDLACPAARRADRGDDTEDRVQGRQELALFHAHYGGYCFLPIHVYEATTGKPVAAIPRPPARPRMGRKWRSSCAT